MEAHHIAYARGSEKIYEKIAVRGLDLANVLTVRAQAEDGSRLPAKIFELATEAGARCFVLVVPDVATDNITVTLIARDASGARIDSCITQIKPDIAMWESRVRGRVGKATAEQIRRYDEGREHEGLSLAFTYAIPDRDEAVLRLQVRSRYREDATLELRCIDRSGHPCADPIAMGEEKCLSRVTGTPSVREVTYSVRVKRGEPVFFEAVERAEMTRSTFDTLLPGRLDELLGEQGFRMLSAQHDPFFEEWLRRNRVTQEELALERETTFAYMPTFSIVVPLFRTPRLFFEEMLASVSGQSYACWELVLVNASPENAELRDLVAKACADDSRVRAITLQENLGISENTNAGLDIASGDFVCFFDHDDILEPDLLFEYAKAIDAHPDTDLIYCDEDKVAEDGRHFDVFFKPDFSIDLLRSNNYVCHLLCVRRELLDSLPRNSREYDGAQDHNLTLRVSEVARHIHHVPRVLYHWRVSMTSTAGNSADKPYATLAGIRAVSDHLARLGIRAEVTQNRWPFTYSVRYLPPEPHPLISIIIPSYEHPGVLRACIDSIMGLSTYNNYEVLVIENNSKDPETFACYDELVSMYGDHLRVIQYPGSFNFSAICNFGASHASGDYLLFLNNDTTVVSADWLERMVGTCARPEVGACGARLLYPDGTIQHAGLVVAGAAANHLHKFLPPGNFGYFNLAGYQQNLSAVTAACMMVRRDAFNLVGGFDESLAVAYNDVDFCLRLRDQGMLVVYDPEVVLCHYESLSRGFDKEGAASIRYRRELARFNERWAEVLVEGDPYYSVNLNQDDPWCCWFHF